MKYQIPDWHSEDKWVTVRGGCPETVAEGAAEQHLHEMWGDGCPSGAGALFGAGEADLEP